MGLSRARELSRREEALLDFKKLLQFFKTGIGYAARPLAELISEAQDSRFCKEAAKNAAALAEPKAALKSAGEKILRDNADIELFRVFVQGLGESDTHSQLEHIAMCAELLESNLSHAAEEKTKKSQLYVCLGLFGGITLCLVLL